jgi:hypothetical protein
VYRVTSVSSVLPPELQTNIDCEPILDYSLPFRKEWTRVPTAASPRGLIPPELPIRFPVDVRTACPRPAFTNDIDAE